MTVSSARDDGPNNETSAERPQGHTLSRGEARAAFVAISALLVAAALWSPAAQDLIPFRIASALARNGQWQRLYLSPAATSLLDVSQTFRDAAATLIPAGTPAVPITGFVSPPPAAFLLSPLHSLTWPTAMVVMRLALALPLCFAVFAWGESITATGTPAARRRAVGISLLVAPLVAYIVEIGQPSAWLVAAAFLSVLPPTLVLDVASGLLLGLAVITKGTPLLVVVGLWIVGRRRLATIAFAVAAGTSVLLWPHTGLEAWTCFRGAASRLSNTILTDWNNVSLDAMFGRLAFHTADSRLRTPGTIVFWTSLLGRAVLLVAAFRVALTSNAVYLRRVGAVWVAWLAATPLLWLHYTATLLPIFGGAAWRRSGPPVLLAAAFSGVSVLRLIGASAMTLGLVGSLAWVGAAALVIHNVGWTSQVASPESPAPGSQEPGHR